MAVPTLRPHIVKSVLVFYCAVLSAIYVFALVNAPLSLLSAAMHDDGLFIAHARTLADLRWFGPYNQFTLAKGPGYPAFLAISHLFGISSSLARALFHCGAVALFVTICHCFMRSYLLSAILFTLLLWDPGSFQGQNLRILRDTIYFGQLLISFGFLAVALLARNYQAALIGGLLFGWLWLTREEGIWLTPGLAVLAAGGLYRGVVERGVLRFLGVGLMAVAAFGFIDAGFRFGNWRVYGAPVAVEYKSESFTNALAAIHSVKTGGTKPFVSVTRAARQAIYSVSPAFAELASYLDGKGGDDWGSITCKIQQFTCGEIGAGVFPWTLRDAVAAAGHYSSPTEAAVFYTRIADEIRAACEAKRLSCERQFIAELPPASWEQLANIPTAAFRALMEVLSAYRQPVNGEMTFATADQLSADLRLLNFPFIMPPDPATKMPYTFRGWYHQAGNKWMSLTVFDEDQVVPILFARLESPDIVSAFNDKDASKQRFSIETYCSGNCVMRIGGEDGTSVQRQLKDIKAGLIEVGKGRFFIDTVNSEFSSAFDVAIPNRVSFRVRQVAMRYFELFRIPILVAGLFAALACLLYARAAALNPTYVLALAMWGLAASRLFIVALLDVTFVPVVNVVYLAPANFVLTAGAVLSIGAWMQLRRNASAAAALSA